MSNQIISDLNQRYTVKKYDSSKRISSEDLTKVNAEAKEHILNKIPESNLMQTANKEALEAISLMQNLVETIGWKLDFSSLELPVSNQKTLQ